MIKTITHSIVKSLLKKRNASSTKHDHGHACIIAGAKGSMGAAVIAAKACLRTGSGLLTVCVPQDDRFILQTAIPEAMLIMRENNNYDLTKFSALGIGPGMGTGATSEKMLANILTHFKNPLLLDADAITILSVNTKLFTNIPKNTILTPHQKEFDRLFGSHKTTEERIKTAIKKAKEHNIIIVLKNHPTIIISKAGTFYNTTGNAGLAKGGSGDALTGIITSFLAQGYKPLVAAKLGVYLHGLAADITLKEQSMESMLITDVIENLGKAFKATMK